MMEVTDMDQITVIVIGVLITLILCVGFIILLLKINRNSLDHQAELQEIELKKKEELLHNSIAAEENERQRIAKELHDDVNNRLVLIQRQLSSTDETLELRAELDKTMGRLREISHELLPPGLEKFGLSAAIEDLIQTMENTHEFEIDSELDEEAEPSSREVHLSIFRIVQELVGNTLKYANADKVKIHLWKEGESGTLEYADNGKGFDPEKAKKNNSLGLKNIESRAAFANANFELISSPGNGMNFKLYWKL